MVNLNVLDVKTWPVSQWLAQADVLLPDSPSAKLDVEVLLCHVLALYSRSDRAPVNRTFLYTWPETSLLPEEAELLLSLLSKRHQGLPVAHLVGVREFWSLELSVSDKTLIPRADTECLVEWILDNVPEDVRVRYPDASFQLVDLGTGTGAIALAVASERPEWRCLGLDFQADAVSLARSNAEKFGFTNVEFIESDWFSAVPKQRFPVIVSNPPYICDDDPHLAQGDVRYEPLSALTSGSDGLNDIRKILTQMTSYLLPDGVLLMEHGYHQGEQVQALFRDAGLSKVETLRDYGNRDRFTVGFNIQSIMD